MTLRIIIFNFCVIVQQLLVQMWLLKLKFTY